MSKESISGKIKTILNPEKEVEELNEKRIQAKGVFFTQDEIEKPTEETMKKVEGLFDDLKKRYVPVPKFDPEANNRRFGAK